VRQEGIVSILSVPVKLRGEVVGVMRVPNLRGRGGSSRDEVRIWEPKDGKLKAFSMPSAETRDIFLRNPRNVESRSEVGGSEEDVSTWRGRLDPGLKPGIILKVLPRKKPAV
jgi:hypothetical protein